MSMLIQSRILCKQNIWKIKGVTGEKDNEYDKLFISKE